MQQFHFMMTSKQDGLELDCLEMIPKNARAIVLIIHGMAEHKERYTEFMEYLANHSVASVIYDQRGHGTKAIEFGYYNDRSANYVVEDAKQLIDFIRSKFELPLVVLGHSMGTLVARQVLKTYSNKIDGMILTGAVYDQGLMAKIGKVLVQILIVWKGEHYRSSFLQKISIEAFNRGFDMTNGWLSCNKENVIAYNNDPRDGFTFTLNGFLNLFTLIIRVYDGKEWEVEKPCMPILFLAGDQDPVVGKDRDFSNMKKALQKQGYQNVSMKRYKDMRHEILQEKDKEKVFADILTFLRKLF